MNGATRSGSPNDLTSRSWFVRARLTRRGPRRFFSRYSPCIHRLFRVPVDDLPRKIRHPDRSMTAVLYLICTRPSGQMMEDGESHDLHVPENKALQLKKRLPSSEEQRRSRPVRRPGLQDPVQNWHEVREIWDWVSHNTGGDDIVYPTTLRRGEELLVPQRPDHPRSAPVAQPRVSSSGSRPQAATDDSQGDP